MSLLSGRSQKPVPAAARVLLRTIPRGFRDDGCSNAPDSVFGFRFRWVCRLHDWRYCTRCHPPGVLTQGWRHMADRELRSFISASLPWRWRWLKWAYYGGVWWAGGIEAFDSCGRDVGDFCRHGIRFGVQ